MGCLNFPGYCLQSSYCRKSAKNGGVAIFSRVNCPFKFHESGFLQTSCVEKEFEICGVSLISENKDVNIELINVYMPSENKDVNIELINVYMPPDSDVKFFYQKLYEVLYRICKTSTKVLCGDFDIDQQRNSCQKTELNNLLTSFGLQNSVSESTRITYKSSTQINYFCTNSKNKYHCSVAHNGISDHSTLVLYTVCSDHDVDVQRGCVRYYSSQNYDRFVTIMFDVSFLLKQRKKGISDNTWVTDVVRDSSVKLKSMFQIAKEGGNAGDWESY
ncbi:Endonuclease-reverse transcriptase [Popillia japonica]|uniref:Endonuclease-reverse transcriptase n=1 Tax=Popillia japonica TaxID=7064 RepID=A0AAW1MQV0_POPJA